MRKGVFILGNEIGATKTRNYLIEQYGGIEQYKESMRKLASKGGKSRKKPNGLDKLTHDQRVINGKLYGRKKKLIQ